MPYMMSDNGLCVHKQNANGTMGDVVKCHKTPEEAAAHMAALYANVEDAATKETGPAGDYLIAEDPQMPSTFHLRVKVDGKPDHGLMGAAWAALMNPNGYRGNKYEGPGKQEAIAKLKRLYEEEKMPIPSEKESLFIVGDTELTDAELQAIEQLYRDVGAGRVTLESLVEPDAATGKASVSYGNRSGGPGGPAGNPSGTPGGAQSSHDSKEERCYLRVKKLGGDETTARKICRSMFGGKADKEAAHEATFSIYKQKDGAYRWVLFTSSSFMDNDGEILSQKAQDADTDLLNETGQYGAVNWWHVYRHNGEWISAKDLTPTELVAATPLRLGECDFSGMHGRVRVETGLFDDPYVAEQFAKRQDELGASLEFFHPITQPDEGKVYHQIKTFSRAILPRSRASNRLTQLYVAKENKEMKLPQLGEFVARLGGDKAAEDKVNEILKAAEQKEQAAVAAGIAAKEAKPEAAPESKPEAAPAEEKETPISKQPGMFVADMTPEEFDAHIANAVRPLIEQLNAIKEANAVAVKESSASVLAAALVEIKKLQDAQAETAKQVKELNGLTPRGYRATQDPATATTKDAHPGADEKKSHFEQFVNGFVLGQPQPPMP